MPCIQVVETKPENPYPFSSAIRICTALLLSRVVHHMDGWVGNEGKAVHEGSGMVGGDWGMTTNTSRQSLKLIFDLFFEMQRLSLNLSQ